ncbi:excalibur calcium-binding domain-containing protein [Streptomyces sp. SAI-170]|uniref:excalibur calcium-binding domain-containing protein n=1 Tax=Streptomyces sp. SAI-170 TaxID=3377729 RepID=UPI003C7AC93A
MGKPGDVASAAPMAQQAAPGAVSWWRRPGFVVFCLVLMPPAGIILAWRTRWGVGRKALASVLSAVWFVAVGTSDPPAEKPATAQAGARSRATPTAFAPSAPSTSPAARPVVVPDYRGQNLEEASTAAYEAGFWARSHDATEDDRSQFVDSNWTVCFQEPAAGTTVTRGERRARIEFAVVDGGNLCPPSDGAPIVFERMPDVVGRTFQAGAAAVRAAGPDRVEAASAYTDVDLAVDHADWRICFQDPEAGETLENPAYITVRLSLVRPGLSCPAEEFARLHPDPDPDYERGGSGDDSGTSGSGGFVYYKNCDAVRAAGKAPIYRGQPGYRSDLDRDGDGKACDWS